MRLENNVNSINTDKFDNHVISIISRKELEAKISVALDLFKLIEDTKHICDSRIDINANDAWATSELLKIQKDLVDIGVSVGKFNLVGKMTSSYNASYTKKKIKEHGYDVSSVSQLIDDTEKLGKQSSRQEMKSITRIISTYFYHHYNFIYFTLYNNCVLVFIIAYFTSIFQLHKLWSS